jgi:hypothetical protein
MRAFIWRALYAAIVVVVFLYLFPLFLTVVGFSPAAPLWLFIRACVACLAVLYVLFGPPPQTPW